MGDRPKIAACIQATGDVVTGVVLYRLLFWWPKANRKIDGRRYFAKAQSDLIYETGLTPKQIKTALSKLRKLGFIQTIQHNFGGKYVTHFLVTNICTERVGEAQSGHPGGPKWDTPGGPDGTPPYIQGGLQGEQQGGLSELALAKDDPVAHSQVHFEGKKKMASVKDTLALTKWGKSHKPDSASELEYTWKTVLSELTGGNFVHLTLKQIGQLKLVKKHVPVNTAAKVIEYTLRHWIEFVKNVETEKGVKSTPSKPNVDFLLKHAAVAASLWAKSQNTASKLEAQAGVQTAQSVKLISQPAAEPKPQTLEELMSILNDEDE